jgi:hypothetical protein
VADIISSVHASGNSSYLHVFVRTQDVKFGKLSTSRSSLSFGSMAHLDEQSNNVGCGASPPSCQAQLPARSASDGALAPLPEQEDSTVIHVVIRKTAHVSWQPGSNGCFELSVAVSDTAAQVKQKLLPSSSDAACPNILADFNVVHNGVHMEADRPLLEYGLSDGDVLDLVPWEPIKPQQPEALARSVIVPALSSPMHDLYKNWQLAASGLRAGTARHCSAQRCTRVYTCLCHQACKSHQASQVMCHGTDLSLACGRGTDP